MRPRKDSPFSGGYGDFVMTEKELPPSPSPAVDFYDPSKEPLCTRLGLSLDSFKRAPGPLV